jgi:hypothetical protein
LLSAGDRFTIFLHRLRFWRERDCRRDNGTSQIEGMHSHFASPTAFAEDLLPK